ncbi:MAG: putative galactarate transporter [Candidatus Thorarchaeota archaeon AB_25]|nr:MAG: putative galactarate transporter [Candidatus Thorarchaeota archaeon AB_25]
MIDEMRHSGLSRYRWIILALAWLVYFAFGLILSSIPPLVNIIAQDLALTYSEMGIILGSVILMYIPLAVPAGVGIDRFGEKKAIALGLLLVSASAILRSFVFSFETLFLVVFLFGFGGPTISVGLAKVVASSFEGRERGIASGIYMTGIVVGSASALAFTNSLILPMVGTWRNVFSFYGIIGFFIAFGWILFAQETTSVSTQSDSVLPMKEMLRSLLGHKYVWMVAIIGSSSFLVFYGFGNWLPTLLEEKGMDPVGAGILASIPIWLGLIGSGIIPGVAVAGKRKPLIVALLLIEGVSIYIVGITSGLTLLASLVIYGIVSGAVMPLMLVIMMDLPEVGAEYTGIASGLFFSIGSSTGFIGPILVGYLTDLTDSFLPALILIAVVVEAMIVLAFVLKED